MRNTGFICSTRPLRQPSQEPKSELGRYVLCPVPIGGKCAMRAILRRMDTLFESDAGAGDPEAAARLRRETIARWRRACGLRRSPTSSARRTSWATARRCGRRSSRGTLTRWSCTDRRAPARRRSRGWSRSNQGGVRGVERRAGGPGRGARGAGAGGSSPRHRRWGRWDPDGVLPRRDPPLQQGPAGRAAAGGRGRSGHADRRDHREPRVRGQRRTALAHARVCIAGLERRGGGDGAAAGGGG